MSDSKVRHGMEKGQSVHRWTWGSDWLGKLGGRGRSSQTCPRGNFSLF